LQALEMITMTGALPRRAGNLNELLETSVIGHDQREQSRQSGSKSCCIMENFVQLIPNVKRVKVRLGSRVC